MKTIAIIPAGGSGKRLRTDVAKQYLELAGIPILVRALQVFQKNMAVDEIVLAVPEKDIDFIRDNFINKHQLSKVKAIVAGGRQRQDSVRNALCKISDDCEIVIVHDGVRPFVTGAMIDAVIKEAVNGKAASIGVKAKDTVKETADSDIVRRTLHRENLWLTQTPQAFQFPVLKEAYLAADRDNYYGTDEASLAERIGIEVKMIAGDYKNIKITTPEDLIFARALLSEGCSELMKTRSGFGYDSHRLVVGRKLVLGGVEIPFAKGLQGHSDADALIHAVCDALLGAAAAGDIGRHFPDNDPSYKDISSMILLDRVAAIIKEKDFTVNNIDITVIMEKPKLAPYADAIAANLARTLELSCSYINIKAKTNEGMGFLGRNEGIAVLAIVTLIESKGYDR